MAGDYGRALGFSFVSSGATQVRTINANASAGEKAVLFACCLEDLTLSVSDSTGAGNVYNVTKIRSTSASPETLFIVYCDLVNPYVSGSTTISLAYSGTQTWGLQEGHVLTGCASGLVEAQTDTNETTPWTTPSSTTTNGSILFGAALYRNAVDCTFAVDSVSPAITALDDLKFGNSNLGSCYRKIATGGTHNISGSWSDLTGGGGATGHLLFAAAAAAELTYDQNKERHKPYRARAPQGLRSIPILFAPMVVNPAVLFRPVQLAAPSNRGRAALAHPRPLAFVRSPNILAPAKIFRAIQFAQRSNQGRAALAHPRPLGVVRQPTVLAPGPTPFNQGLGGSSLLPGMVPAFGRPRP